VRDALSWGPVAPQPPPIAGLRIPGDPEVSDEDCLSLNIWTPGLDDRMRPVLVWVHGGGFTTGSGASVVYRGDRLASRGDVVVVTLNYRLGALGFLAHPALGDGVGPGYGNWGLYDQVAALEWVHEHVDAFGGDPQNVTVFGESAGAMSISVLLASSACGRLFHRAVVQSGPPATASVEWGARRAERLAEIAGVEPVGGFDRESLERLEPQELIRATEDMTDEVAGEVGLPLPLLPVVDGELLTRPPAKAISEGATARVPFLVGTTRDEVALFMEVDPSSKDIDMRSLIRRVERIAAKSGAQSLVEAYSDSREARGEPTTPRDLLIAITTDYVFRLPSLALATASHKHQPATFAYLFTWESPFLGGILGSTHGLEIPFVFGTVENEVIGTFSGSGPQAFELSVAMQEAWLAFARTGDPSCDALGDWPSYDPLCRPTMVLGPGRGIADDPRGSERLAWDGTGIEITGGHHHEIRRA
jgi:para-nitrobenzyl esterase